MNFLNEKKKLFSSFIFLYCMTICLINAPTKMPSCVVHQFNAIKCMKKIRSQELISLLHITYTTYSYTRIVSKQSIGNNLLYFWFVIYSVGICDISLQRCADNTVNCRWALYSEFKVNWKTERKWATTQRVNAKHWTPNAFSHLVSYMLVVINFLRHVSFRV